MFPLALFPTVPDNLQDMKYAASQTCRAWLSLTDHSRARDALVYQNTFMKVTLGCSACHWCRCWLTFAAQNALIRALNITYEMARKIEAVHPEFCSFLAYMESVCNILSLHLEGENVTGRSQGPRLTVVYLRRRRRVLPSTLPALQWSCRREQQNCHCISKRP